jgi:hypothetical protein
MGTPGRPIPVAGASARDPSGSRPLEGFVERIQLR